MRAHTHEWLRLVNNSHNITLYETAGYLYLYIMYYVYNNCKSINSRFFIKHTVNSLILPLVLSVDVCATEEIIVFIKSVFDYTLRTLKTIAILYLFYNDFWDFFFKSFFFLNTLLYF
jgi:hypothetical protein